MTADELENLLRAWGRIYGEQRVLDDQEDGPARADHPLARAQSFAPGKAGVIRQRTAAHRAGQDRRRLLAAASGVKGMRIVAQEFVDPVPCSETRSGRDPARDWPVPAPIAKVERAALDLLRVDPLRGLCLRAAYCTRGSRSERAEYVSQRLGEPVRPERFRDELRFARVWIHGRVA